MQFWVALIGNKCLGYFSPGIVKVMHFLGIYRVGLGIQKGCEVVKCLEGSET